MINTLIGKTRVPKAIVVAALTGAALLGPVVAGDFAGAHATSVRPCSFNYTENHPTVAYGSTGNEVKQLQCALTAFVPHARLTLDGIFGQQTLAVLRSYQSSRGLTVDGVAGPKTWSRLNYDWRTTYAV